VQKKLQTRSVLRTPTAASPWEANYQPTGTLTPVTGKWTQNITQHGSDHKLGCLSCVKFSGKGTHQTTFITAYLVCDQTPITQDYVYGPYQSPDGGTKLRTSHTYQF
jgi:hypothetical protein